MRDNKGSSDDIDDKEDEEDEDADEDADEDEDADADDDHPIFSSSISAFTISLPISLSLSLSPFSLFDIIMPLQLSSAPLYKNKTEDVVRERERLGGCPAHSNISKSLFV